MHENCWCRQCFWESYSKAANDAAQSLAVRRNKEAGVRDLFRKAVARLIPLQVIAPFPTHIFIHSFICSLGRLYKSCPTSGPCPRCLHYHFHIPALPPSSIRSFVRSFMHALTHSFMCLPLGPGTYSPEYLPSVRSSSGRQQTTYQVC